MDYHVIILLVICISGVCVAGCTTHSPQPAGTTTLPVSTLQTIPGATASPVQVTECTSAVDCIPAECCHPSGCIPKIQKQPCNVMCTASCEGPLDCGAGSCGCMNGTCRIIPVSSAYPSPTGHTRITIKASPQRYSPIMSSTPGIGLEPNLSGFSTKNASFAWSATCGQFLSWDSPDFRVNQLGDTARNHGEKLYWSFTERPSSTATPVTITVIATDTESGRLLGRSTVTLAWEENYSVTVKEIE